jgi:hypothetical protein
MRRLAAISLLFLHLFSVSATLLIHTLAVYRADRFFESQVARGLYNINDLTEVKIPVDLPGIADQTFYQNVLGEVRFENAAYNYVKIKWTHNAIYLKCVPNYSTTRLCGQNIIDAKALPEIPVNKKDHVPFDKMFGVSLYNKTHLYYRFLMLAQPVQSLPCVLSARIINSSITSPGQPPETT